MKDKFTEKLLLDCVETGQQYFVTKDLKKAGVYLEPIGDRYAPIVLHKSSRIRQVFSKILEKYNENNEHNHFFISSFSENADLSCFHRQGDNLETTVKLDLGKI